MMTTPRELVKKAVRFQRPERVPRDYWILPWAQSRYADEIVSMQEAYPSDFVQAKLDLKRLDHMEGPLFPVSKDVIQGEKNHIPRIFRLPRCWTFGRRRPGPLRPTHGRDGAPLFSGLLNHRLP